MVVNAAPYSSKIIKASALLPDTKLLLPTNCATSC